MLRFQIDDMTCGHCAQAITQAVKRVDAGADVRVDLASKQVEVTSGVGGETVAEAIRGAGYSPRLSPPPEAPTQEAGADA